MNEESMAYPTEMAQELRILTPDDGLGEVGDAAVRELANHGFAAATGLTRAVAGALTVIGRQKHIVEYCPREPERLSSVGQVARWQAAGRGFVGIYAIDGHENWPVAPASLEKLTEDRLRLAAYGWSRHERNEDHLPGVTVTTAYRVAEDGRELARRVNGIKLGLPIGRLVLATAVHVFEASRPDEIGLETWLSNAPARRLYDALGFVERARHGANRVTQQTPEQLRLNGTTYFCERDEDDVTRRYVRDARVYMQYGADKI
jgi:ribosomal protein S18 acetylase RimI-like enzyme